jgi:hypothetical protein
VPLLVNFELERANQLRRIFKGGDCSSVDSSNPAIDRQVKPRNFRATETW